MKKEQVPIDKQTLTTMLRVYLGQNKPTKAEELWKEAKGSLTWKEYSDIVLSSDNPLPVLSCPFADKPNSTENEEWSDEKLLVQLCEKENISSAEEIYNKLKQAHRATPEIHCTMLATYRKLRNFDAARNILKEYEEVLGSTPYEPMYYWAIVNYTESYEVARVIETFDRLTSRGGIPSLAMFSVLINFFGRKLRRFDQTLFYWNQMKKFGVLPDAGVYIVFLQCLKDNGAPLQQVKSVVEEAKANGAATIQVYTSYLRYLLATNHVKEARDLFEKLKKSDPHSVGLYVSMLNSPDLSSEEASNLLAEFQRKFPKTPAPNQAYVAVLRRYLSAGQINKVEEVFQKAHNEYGISFPGSVRHKLVKFFIQTENYKLLEELVLDPNDATHDVDYAAIKALMSHYTHNNLLQEALRLHAKLKQRGSADLGNVAYKIISRWHGRLSSHDLFELYTDTMNSHIETHNWRGAIRIIEESRRDHYLTPLDVYISVFRMLGNRGKVQEAYELYQLFEADGYTPTVDVLDAVIPSLVLRDGNKAEELFAWMIIEGMTPSLRIYQSMLNLYSDREDPIMAEQILRKISCKE